MRSKAIGDVLVNPQGGRLTIVKWLPGKGLYVNGEWLLRDSNSVNIRLSSLELTDKGYKYIK